MFDTVFFIIMLEDLLDLCESIFLSVVLILALSSLVGYADRKSYT